MTAHRTTRATLVDPATPLRFTFDGSTYRGVEGDTLALALLANGVYLMGRSFRYHRLRGPLGARGNGRNAIVGATLNGRSCPNCPATTTPLVACMQARAVNASPSARFDIKSGLDLFHRWLGSGVYQRTFMCPDAHLFEPMIRKMADLGDIYRKAPENHTADQVHDP